jgi:gliding motility-associated-like protein
MYLGRKMNNQLKKQELLMYLGRKIVVITLLLHPLISQAQAPGCPNISLDENFTADCSSPSSILTADFLETGETSSYEVSSIPFSPPYSFSTGNPIFIGIDDHFSDAIDLPFDFCFYENTFDQIIVGANGLISFDTYLADSWCAWEFNSSIPTPSNDPGAGEQTGIYNNSINGAYHDMDPSEGGSIYYDILGEFPCRTFVVNWYSVPQYLCTDLETTQQIVIYESTNVIEVYIDNKPTCDGWFGWNDGNAVIGIQNENGTEGLTPPGRNTGSWTASNEAWRFTPGGVPNYIISWYDDALNLLGNNNTLNISPSATTTYTAEITYSNCNAEEITASDDITVFVNNTAPDLSIEDVQICEGEVILLSSVNIIDNNSTIGTISYHTNFPANDFNEITNLSISPTTTTVYYVLKVTADDCEDTEFFTVFVTPMPIINAGVDFAVCGLMATLNGISSVNNNSWISDNITFTDNGSLTTGVESSVYGSQVVTLNAEENGCEASPEQVSITFLESPTANAGIDIDICTGENTQLNASGNGSVLWTPATGLSSATVANPIVSGLTDSTLYTLTVTSAIGNSIVNGDFELGSTGFSSDFYTPTSTGTYGLLSWEGTFAVNNSAANVHDNFYGFDFNNPPDGNFMIVNGGSTPNTNVWCQDVSVVINTEYEFSTWISTVVAESPAILEFSINGILLGNPFTAPTITSSWEEYTTTWFSDLNTTATICIVNQNTNTSGNDFGIDEITFSPVCSSTDEVWVNIQPTLEAVDQTPTVCEDNYNSESALIDLTLLESSVTTNPSAIISWYNDINLSSPITNASSFTTSINQYVYASLSAPLTCSNTAIVSYNINPMPEANSISADFCEDLTSGIVVDLPSFANQITTGASVNWVNNLGNIINNTNSYPLTESTTLFSQVTNSFGCENEAPLSLQLNTTPDISAITSDEICQSENYNLASITIVDNNNANGDISYHSGSPANSGNQISNLVNPSSTSLYYLLSTTNDGCKDEIPFNLIVHPTPTPDAGIDDATCGLNYSLNASQTSGTTANWQIISNASINEINNPNSTVSVTDYGTFSFVWEETSPFGCYSNSTVNILFVPSPTISGAGNVSICPGEDVSLNASPENYTNISWNTSGSGYFLDYQSNSTTYTPSDLDIANNGAYLTCTAFNSPCPPNSTNTELEIHNTPTSIISGEGDLCDNVDSVAVLVLGTSGIPPYSLSIQQNGEEWMEHITYSSSDTIIVVEEGFYEISAITDSNCEGTTSGSVSVFKRPVPYAQFTSNPSVAYIGNSEIVFYNNSQLADVFVWDFGDSTYNSLDYNPIHTYTDTGKFQISLQISNEFGCTDSVTHTIIIHPHFHFYIPNAFTPNGDNENDVFIGKGEGIADYQLTIFNRWGGIIFYSNNIKEGWNGVPKSASEISPIGTYSYKVDVTDLLGKKHTYTGEVSLIR